jgi:hypothetical protein
VSKEYSIIRWPFCSTQSTDILADAEAVRLSVHNISAKRAVILFIKRLAVPTDSS